MTKKALLLLSLIVVLALPPVSADYPSEPEGDWYLIDHGQVLSENQELEMEHKLMDVQNSTGALVRVVTIRSMEEMGVSMDVEYFDENDGYAREMYEHYGMEGGEQKTILIALSVEDRRFKFVMPGHSGFVQSQSQAVFENDVAPNLGEDRWNAGLTSAIDGIEPYAADDVAVLPKFVFWGILMIALLCIPLVIMKTKKDFAGLNYSGLETRSSYNRVVKEALIQRGKMTLEAMDGDDDSKAKWELLNDINTINEFDENGKFAIGFLGDEAKAIVRITKRADELNIEEDNMLELEDIDREIENINKHISAGVALQFGRYVSSLLLFVVALLIANTEYKTSGLRIDDVSLDFEPFQGLQLILIPLLLAVAWTVLIKLRPSSPEDSLDLYASVFFREYGKNNEIISSRIKPLSKTTNASGAVLIPGFLGLTGVTNLRGYNLVSTGRDEFGNETYDVERDYTSSGDSGGGGCGGGGCGGGGCGGGGGF